MLPLLSRTCVRTYILEIPEKANKKEGEGKGDVRRRIDAFCNECLHKTAGVCRVAAAGSEYKTDGFSVMVSARVCLELNVHSS